MENLDYSQTMKEIEYFLWHEFADHYIEMVKSSLYKKENMNSIRYTLYNIGLGILKIFSPFFPHITEEIYQNNYKIFENEKSIHISSWPKEIIIDEEKEKSGEIVKKFISQIRSYKSEKGIALNSPLNAIKTYSTEGNIKALNNNSQIIKTTLNLPDNHEFIIGKPDIKEEIVDIIPQYAKIGPLFKKDSKDIINWIQKNKQKLISKIKTNNDIKWSDIDIIKIEKDEKLVKNNYIKIIKKSHIEGKKDIDILQIDNFYIELLNEA
jgi:valyl-tRNA synthetase